MQSNKPHKQMYQIKLLSRCERRLKVFLFYTFSHEIMAYQKRKHNRKTKKKIDSKLAVDVFIELIIAIGINLFCIVIGYFAFIEGFYGLISVMVLTFIVSTIAHYKYIDNHLRQNM